MLLIPLRTPLLKKGDSLLELLCPHTAIQPSGHPAILSGDILVVSSKAVATVEGGMIDLRMLSASDRARDLSRRMKRSPEFCEAMLQELQRLNGDIIGAVPGAALTEVRPEGLNSIEGSGHSAEGSGHSARVHSASILVANAGLDESNVAEGFAIGWPKDPVMSVRKLREELEKEKVSEVRNVKEVKDVSPRTPRTLLSPHTPFVAVILSDSTCMPRRHGVTAFALTVSGLDPLQSQKGKTDLFGKPLKITTEAIADQLATAANFLMGNAGQSTPAVIIRDHGLELSEWEGWTPGIEPERDLFREILR